MSTVPNITLNNGVEIPQLGFGTYKIPPDATVDACLAAFEVGYRHVDTAQMYGNEAEVGEAVRRSGLDRSEVFVTSKLDNGFHEPSAALTAFDASLGAMGFDYLDLFLIHWPLPKLGVYVDTWKAMEQMLESGRVRAIGVSNFQPHHLERLADAELTVPAVNQIEVHPYFTQNEARSVCLERGIAVEAWSPLGRGTLLDDPTIVDIADRLGRTPAQVVLRWHLQRGDVVIPKTVTPSRLAENFGVFDFELAEADMVAISGLDRGGRLGPDPDQFNPVG